MSTANEIPHHIKKAIRALAEISPDLAARIATFAMTRTKRRPLRSREGALLARAERFEIRHGHQRIAAWSWGSGPIVHLVHGWNGRATDLGAFVDPLVASGVRVVAHDSIGHGVDRVTGRNVAMARARVRDVVPFDDALAIVRSIRDAGLVATSGAGHARILRSPEVIEDVVRFTTADDRPAARRSGPRLTWEAA